MKVLRHAACVAGFIPFGLQILAIAVGIFVGVCGTAQADFTVAPAGNLSPGSPCTITPEWVVSTPKCAGDNYCLGSPPHCRPLAGGPENAPSSPHANSPQIAPTPAASISAEKTNIDPRLSELQKRFSTLLEQARARKITYLKAARLYRQWFNDLFPEQASNDLMNEYLAYMAVLGERIDKKKLTEAESEYELARKMNELRDRALAREAPQREEVARRASDEAARASRQAAAQAEQEQRRIAQERELAERRAAQERELAQQRVLAAQAAEQAEKQRRQDAMMTGLQILLGPRPAPMPVPTINVYPSPAPPPQSMTPASEQLRQFYGR